MDQPPVFTSLLVRPRPGDTESRWGYWLRLACENGLRRPQWLLEADGRWASGKTRVCPACLQTAKAYWHKDWEGPEAYWCAQHMTWLVDECPGCRRSLRWDGIRFLECGCGFDLRAIETVPVDERIPGHLEARDISMAGLRVLGAFALFGSASKPGKKATRSGLTEVCAQIGAGVDLVDGWPTSFIEALDRHRVPARMEGTAQLLAQAFPRLRELCTQIPDDIWRVRVEDVIRDYCARSLSGSDPIVGRNAVLGIAPMTLKQVATRLGTRVESVARAIDAHVDEIRGKRLTAQGRLRRIVGEEDLLRLKDLLQEHITTTGAARLLALPVARVRAIVRSGLLTQVNGRLSRSQVEEFAVASAHKVQVTTEVLAPLVPVRLALRDWVPVDDTGAFLSALRSGEVLAKTEGASDSLGEWLMSGADAEAWSRKHRLEGRASLTLTRAAAVLAVKQDVVRDLVRTGLLSARRAVFGGRQGWWIEPSHLHAFKERYVPLAHLAMEAGVRNRDGFAWARHEGLNVVTGPRVDGSRQYFVDRRSNTAKGEQGSPVDQLCVAEVH